MSYTPQDKSVRITPTQQTEIWLDTGLDALFHIESHSLDVAMEDFAALKGGAE